MLLKIAVEAFGDGRANAIALETNWKIIVRKARYVSKRRQMVYSEHQSQNQLPTGIKRFSAQALHIAFSQPCGLEEMLQQASFELAVGVYWH